MWQEAFEKYGSDDFTIVGLALDAEGIEPAKLYYERFGVTFPSLVDPDYATQFAGVPKTIFVDENGVVLESKDWEKQLAKLDEVSPITDDVRAQWSLPSSRLDSAAIARLTEANSRDPDNLTFATELASRYLALGLNQEARLIIERAIEHREPRKVARAAGSDAKLLGQAFFQLSRSYEGDRSKQEKYASISFYLNPSVGFGKQIARIIAPEKFDGRPNGDFDNRFREATLTRLRRERESWLEIPTTGNVGSGDALNLDGN